jgi:formiminoglutamase
MQHFNYYEKQDVLKLTKIRRFETKLGERVSCKNPAKSIEETLQNTEISFVVFGVPEDIGVKANLGTGGTDTAWQYFLKSFLNIQSNDFMDGNNILLLGHFEFVDLEQLIEQNANNYDEKIEALRHAVNTIDGEVEKLVQLITQHNKMPIVIGGGHNNAYGCIKGAAKGWHKGNIIPQPKINCINLDAHADYRPMEGRHSGNAFRYAEADGFLDKYCVIGLHENYIQQNVWMDMLNNTSVDFITYEEIFLYEKRNFLQSIGHAVNFTNNTLVGIELDLDSISNVLSSAFSPFGFSTNHARQFLYFAAADTKPAYLHICEGATYLSDGQTDMKTGKLISYLVTDFIKAIAV